MLLKLPKLFCCLLFINPCLKKINERNYTRNCELWNKIHKRENVTSAHCFELLQCLRRFIPWDRGLSVQMEVLKQSQFYEQPTAVSQVVLFWERSVWVSQQKDHFVVWIVSQSKVFQLPSISLQYSVLNGLANNVRIMKKLWNWLLVISGVIGL